MNQSDLFLAGARQLQMTESIELKLCSRCKYEKSLAPFSKSSRVRDGLCHECKVCRDAAHQAKAVKIQSTNLLKHLEKYSDMLFHLGVASTQAISVEFQRLQKCGRIVYINDQRAASCDSVCRQKSLQHLVIKTEAHHKALCAPIRQNNLISQIVVGDQPKLWDNGVINGKWIFWNWVRNAKCRARRTGFEQLPNTRLNGLNCGRDFASEATQKSANLIDLTLTIPNFLLLVLLMRNPDCNADCCNGSDCLSPARSLLTPKRWSLENQDDDQHATHRNGSQQHCKGDTQNLPQHFFPHNFPRES